MESAKIKTFRFQTLTVHNLLYLVILPNPSMNPSRRFLFKSSRSFRLASRSLVMESNSLTRSMYTISLRLNSSMAFWGKIQEWSQWELTQIPLSNPLRVRCPTSAQLVQMRAPKIIKAMIDLTSHM